MGRNELCWCGSGKKYKKCHLIQDQEEDRREEYEDLGDPDYTQLVKDLMDRSPRWHSRTEFREAWILYFNEDPEMFEPEEEQLDGFFTWYIRDYRAASRGRTAVEDYLREEKTRLSERQFGMLESWRDSRFGLYEVQRVEAEKGIAVKDALADGEEIFVRDISSSRTLVQWDCFIGRIDSFEGIFTLGGASTLVPRMMMRTLIDEIEAARQASGLSAAEFVKANSHRMHRMVMDLHRARMANMRVVNFEGDAVEFCAATYKIRDEAALLAALRGRPELLDESGEKGAKDAITFAWLGEEDEAGARRSYGHIEIAGDELRLECMSRRRLELGRRLLEEAAGNWIEHREDRVRSIAKALEESPKEERGPTTRLPPEIEAAAILQMKEKHYASWPDVALPALNGKTPREASRTVNGRKELRDLLRGMENNEAQERKEGRAAYDFGKLRRELGIDEA
jgi:hypothetical protein